MEKIDVSIVNQLAEKIWQYHLLHMKVEKSDILLVLGSNDPRVAEYAAELLLKGLAPRAVFSGGIGRLTEGLYGMPEGEFFARIAMDKGVPISQILIEDRSTNTNENIRFSRFLLSQKKIIPGQIMIVQKPYMERRTFAAALKEWPDVKFIVTSPNIPFSEYPTNLISRDDLINMIVADLQRIKVYAEKGFQIPQTIPSDVWEAYETLVKKGYNRYLVRF